MPDVEQAQPGRAYVVAQVALLGALAFEARHPRGGLRRLVGVLALLIGGSIAVSGASRLGTRLRADPTPPDDAVLRTDGAYAHVRHPIYAGLLLSAAGLVALAGRGRTIVLWLMLLAVLVRKTDLEERLLVERFPEYEAYAARTPRFLPRVLRAW